MANLAVPVPASEVAGNLITGALWNANVYNGLTFLLNPPTFYGYQNATQAAATGWRSVGIDTGVIDPYNGHSNTTNNSRYTAQVAGNYLVGGAIGLVASSGSLIGAYVAKNGSEIQGSRAQVGPMSGHNNGLDSALVEVQMNVNDYVEIFAYSDTNIGTAGNPYCSMIVHFIHA